MVDFILGLPITQDSITPEFLEIVNSTEPVLLIGSVPFSAQSNDYKTTQVGYDIIINAGFKFIYSMNNFPAKIDKNVLTLDLWERSKGVKDPCIIRDNVVSLSETLKKTYNCKTGYLTIGSPRLYDSVSKQLKILNPAIPVIDTKSSSELAYEVLNIDKPYVLVDNKDIKIIPNSVNMLGCIGSIYSHWADYDMLELLDNNWEIYDIKLGYINRVERLSKRQLIELLNTDKYYFNTSTLAIVT